SKYAAQTADNIHDRWLTIQRQLKAEADELRPLLKISSLELDELAALNGFLNQVDAAIGSGPASQGEPPSPTLAVTLDSAIPTVSSALARVGAERTRLADQIASLNQQTDQLKHQLEPLTTELPNHLTLPPHVARMQEILTPIIGKKPPLLYEFIDVPDSRWQNAVEAVLGPCRFHAIVSATWYDAAKSALLAARANEDLGDADVHDPTQAYNRPARPRSLAEKVTTIYPDLRAYLDYMLGDIITCEWPDELRLHPRAVTPDVTLHSEWQARTVSPAEYQPIVIGKNAARLQSEARQRQAADINRKLANIGDQLAELTPRLKHAETLIRHLSHANALAPLRTALDEPLDERPARAEAAAYEAELGSLDLTPVNELKAKAEQLRAGIARQSRTKDEISHKLVSLEFDLRIRQNELSAARVAFDVSNAEAASTRSRLASAVAAAEGMLPDHLKGDDLSESIRSVEQKERDFDKRARDERLRLIEAISAINAVYQLAQWPGEPTDERYAQADQRLAEVDLPRVKAQIAAAEREMEDELNDHILRPLREYLTHAHRTLEQINDTLTELGAPYRLHAEPAPETKDFYAMIVEHPERSLEGAKSKDAVDALNILAHFYEVLTTQPDSASHLTDYRRYLNYSIEVKGPDGQTARFTRADDEAQIAFYIAIAASFAQVYRIRGERLGRPCIRLVPFGSLFAQMDAAQIAPALDLFRRFGLQLAAAVPLERSDYLVPSLPSTVVLTPVGNSVVAEPYRNYAALPQS
ncbi:MAG TPA: SbcC/MukB-like Walker B domain-containing protein, partial [Anaerolineales bacterium]|nr:SbcC/MukB-like Walker B domain-containing protein [Anaerolineales bacterium]